MREKRINRGFTLIEIVIVLVILALLIWVLFRVYRTIAEISLRVRYEKNMGNSIVTMQTILQNVVDTYTVDYPTFVAMPQSQSTPWWTYNIPLRANDSSLASLMLSGGELLLSTISGWVVHTASLLWPENIFTGATFVLSPITDPAKERNFSQIYQPGFWLIGTLQPKKYPLLHFPVHTFFSFLQK